MAQGSRISAVIMANLRASPGKSAVLLMGTVVLVVMLVRQVGGRPSAATAEIPVAMVPGGDPDAVAAAPETAGRDYEPRPRLRHTLARDPFAATWMGIASVETTGTPMVMQEELQLQCTMVGSRLGERAAAVINGVLVYPGSTLGSLEVVRIGARHVVLSDGTRTIDLRMP